MEDTLMKQNRISVGQLVFGLVLIWFGTATFLDSIDLFEIGEYWRYWPLVLILIGATSELDALIARKSGGGFVLMAVGTWFLARMEMFGLAREAAFPLAMVIVGAGLTLHALLDRPVAVAPKEENEHDQ